MEIIETTAKSYEWHDLRKNPDDVPTEDGNYLVRHRHGALQVVEWADGWNCFRIGDALYKDNEMHNVTAWKAIEPFK